MNDLVERLRHFWPSGKPCPLAEEAADRIEDLEKAAWRVIANWSVGDLSDAVRELERVAGAES